MISCILVRSDTNRLLIELLHVAPSLKFLSIKYNWGDYTDYEALDLADIEAQYKLVKFFFKNAEQLKKYRTIDVSVIRYKLEIGY